MDADSPPICQVRAEHHNNVFVNLTSLPVDLILDLLTYHLHAALSTFPLESQDLAQRIADRISTLTA
jgi:hypothetical protein